MRAQVLTHRSHGETLPAIGELIVAAERAGVTLVFDDDEAVKHDIKARPGVEFAPCGEEDICIVLGGDGTILRALQLHAGTQIPRLRGQLRCDRLPLDGRARRHGGGVRGRVRRRL